MTRVPKTGFENRFSGFDFKPETVSQNRFWLLQGILTIFYYLYRVMPPNYAIHKLKICLKLITMHNGLKFLTLMMHKKLLVTSDSSEATWLHSFSPR